MTFQTSASCFQVDKELWVVSSVCHDQEVVWMGIINLFWFWVYLSLLSYGISVDIAFFDIAFYLQRENGQALTDEEIRAEVRTFMFAGLDTVTSGEEFVNPLFFSCPFKFWIITVTRNVSIRKNVFFLCLHYEHSHKENELLE